MAVTLITGANRGIGLALAAAHAMRGDQVIAVCRQSTQELSALGVRVIDGIDICAAADVARLREALGKQAIDRLILNAGVLGEERLGELDDDAFARMRRQFEVNALAPLRLVEALRPTLGRGSRIGIVSSRMGSIADNGSGGYYGYRMSKAAVNAAGRSLAIDLRADGIAVLLLHPGYVRTAMTGHQGDLTPEQSANILMRRLDELDLAHSGEFRHGNGELLPW